MILRPYQIDAERQIRQEFHHYRRVLYVAPTGSGKTVLFCSMAAQAAARKTRTCILVHRTQLIDQTSAALTANGIPHGIISPHFKPSTQLIQVASVQTLARRLSKYTFDFLIIDEAHHSTAETWLRSINAYPSAFVLGVTATACRLAGAGLGTVFHRMILGPTVPDLQMQGYLCPCTAYVPPTSLDLSSVHTQAGDYNQHELAEAVERSYIMGDAVDHYSRICPGVPTVAFCVDRLRAEETAERFRQAGFRAAAIDGTIPVPQQRQLINSLATGDLHVLASCQLIDEGVDVPVLVCAIDLAPTRSVSRYLQRMGRIIRPAPGKTRAYILDHVGNTPRCGGPPDIPRHWTLDDGLKSKPGTSPVRTCPDCFACHTIAPLCPECGHIYQAEPTRREPNQVDGELVEFTANHKKDLISKCHTYDEFKAVGQQLGYAPQWAWMRYSKSKWKRTPKGETVSFAEG